MIRMRIGRILIRYDSNEILDSTLDGAVGQTEIMVPCALRNLVLYRRIIITVAIGDRDNRDIYAFEFSRSQ